jgi:flagellar basal-body rod modification protein FlgD
MAVSAISGTGATQDQFLQILIAQLQNQDPLEPVSPGDFVAQLSSLSMVEGLATLNANFSEMLKLQVLTQGVGLLGKSVEFIPPGGGPNETGTVDSVTVENGQFVLMIGDTAIGLDQIVSIHA